MEQIRRPTKAMGMAQVVEKESRAKKSNRSASENTAL
jgi:hypothetical protein